MTESGLHMQIILCEQKATGYKEISQCSSSTSIFTPCNPKGRSHSLCVSGKDFKWFQEHEIKPGSDKKYKNPQIKYKISAKLETSPKHLREQGGL